MTERGDSGGEPGQTYGSYRIERLLARGGMAAVYAAHDDKHDRLVALKVFSRDVSSQTDSQRFAREVRISAQLQHPHVCPVYDSGQTDGQLWFAMPLVAGQSLRSRLAATPRPPLAFVRRVIRESAQGLAAAHAAGVLHRDVKPENLLLGADDSILVADFGIARAHGAPPGDATLTATGMLIGTPAYMSPEQFDGLRTLAPATDQYALALVAYEMLAGRHPFAGPDGKAPGMLRFVTEPVPLHTLRTDLSPTVSAVLTRAMHDDPAQRFPSITAFAAAFDEALSESAASSLPISRDSHRTGAPTPPRPGRRGTVLATLFVAGLAGLAAILIPRLRAGRGPAHAAGPVRLAVLPFENVGAATDSAFADGVSDAVRSRLTQSNDLEVVARQSSVSFPNRTSTLADVARALDATLLLTGTVRWSRPESLVVITPALVRVSGGRDEVVWSESVRGNPREVFALHDQVSERVARTMDATLRGTTDRARFAGTRNLDAYDAFIRGEQESEHGSVADPLRLQRADSSYSRAVTLDPRFGLAWSRLAWARAFHLAIEGGDSTRQATTLSTVDSARRYAPDEPYTYLAASIATRNTGNQQQALALALDGVQRFPRDAILLAQAATVLQRQGELDSAQVYVDRARRLDPRSPTVLLRAALIANERRRFATTDTVTAAALELTPSNGGVHVLRILSALGAGDTDEARRRVEAAIASAGLRRREMAAIFVRTPEYLRVTPSDVADEFLSDRDGRPLAVPDSLWSSRLELLTLRGDSAAARRLASTIVQRMRQQNARAGVDMLAAAIAGQCDDAQRSWTARDAAITRRAGQPAAPQLLYLMAHAATWCGDRDAALGFLGRLVRTPGVYSGRWIALDPHFASLRDDPRFADVVRQP